MILVDGHTLSIQLNILLADDDKDDRLLFEEALKELHVSANLTTVQNGLELMELLTKEKKLLWDLLFLDLNMPKKDGLACLLEIKDNTDLQSLTVIIFSTSFELDTVNLLHKHGAAFYFRKPPSFRQLKNGIEYVIASTFNKINLRGSTENFIVETKTNG